MGITKKCTKCARELSLDNFNKDKRLRSGLNSWCRECRCEANLHWRMSHKEEISIFNKMSAEKNKEVRSKYNKQYRIQMFIKDPDVYKRYKRENKDKVNNVNQKRRARIRNTDNSYTLEQWDSCKVEFKNKCAYCDKEVKLTREHFIPLIKGGEYTLNNIIPICGKCNASKNDSDFFVWYPKQKFYSKQRERKILQYLGYNEKNKTQQLALM